jgi:hypothetical protein
MNVKEMVQGNAIFEQNCFARRKIMGMERVPKMSGMIRISLSGFEKG